MIERVVAHPTGRFARCRTCGSEPRHIRASGTSSREPAAFGMIASRHSLECRCGARTARHDTITAAETEWGMDYAQLSLPLCTARRRRRRAAA